MPLRRKAAITVAALLLLLPAAADVFITVFQNGPDVVARAVGTLDLPPSPTISHCGGTPGLFPSGAISPSLGALCLGKGTGGFSYSIAGPQSFGPLWGRPASLSSGNFFGFSGTTGELVTASPEVDAISIWRDTTLSDLGFLDFGPIAEWTTLHPSPKRIALAVVPGPLAILAPLFAYRHSRILRQRLRSSRK